ncbi:lysophospholipid acyltransferase family protein [candidate division WOR-3 bacterium]|nr:lysophospholipid acyltransferase family protein [candidate division WOR-3 bacterium]
MNKFSVYVFLERIIETFNENSYLKLAQSSSKIARIILKRNHSALLKNLSIAISYGGVNQNNYKLIAEKNFNLFALNLIEFLGRSGRKAEEMVEGIEGDVDSIRKLLDGGESIIALSGHIGNWELLGSFGTVFGHPLYVIAAEHYFEGDSELFMRKREERGVGSICAGRIYSFLKKNQDPHILAVLADRSDYGRKVEIEIFGGVSVFSQSSFKLAQKFYRYAVFPFALKTGNGKYIVYIHGPYETGNDESADFAKRKLLKKYVKLYENYAGNFPEQWHFYRRFFK